MRRGAIIAIVILSGLAAVLAVSLASVGTQLDDARIERKNLEFEVEDVQQELDLLAEERDALKAHADEQTQTITQLKAEMERVRSQPPAAAPVEPVGSTP